MRFLSFGSFLIFSLFSFSVLAFTFENAEIGKVPVIKVVSGFYIADSFSGDGDDVALYSFTVGFIDVKMPEIKEQETERIKFLDTRVRFEHLTKYAYFMDRGRKAWKYS